MPIVTTYPGVYVEELPSPVRTIVGVATSTTAFIGRSLKGPTDRAELIHGFPDYYRTFGDLWKESNMSYAVYQYFLNGGQDAVIVRIVGDGTIPVVFDVKDSAGAEVFKLEASSPGSWGNNLKIYIDTTDIDKVALGFDDTLFKLIINFQNDAGQVLQNEIFQNLSTKPTSPRFVKDVLEQQSQLVVVGSESITAKQPKQNEKDPVTGKPTPLAISTPGSDGNPITPDQVKGSPGNPKSGMYLLDDVDIFNMLCIPPFEINKQTTSGAVYTQALGYLKETKRRAIVIVDPPHEWTHKSDPLNSTTGVDGILARDENAAIFFPRILAADSKQEDRLREFVPCGAVAGVIARTDTARGIWKAPAGIEATLAGVPDLTVHLTDGENGELNPMGINCLRIMPGGIGRVVWGSRTMKGADRLADQWKYLPVRRTALYIEESLYRGTQWVVFEPNDYRLWSQIRLNIGDFMHDLFRQGAFQGSDPKKAYFVKCDDSTTTQYDIDRGIVNIVVGFAPLKPAEFVVLQIQQIASQEEGA